MRYTLVIPAYNAASFIGDALRSAFAQSIPPVRAIVVDDGSTDGTADAVRAFGAGVELVTQANSGPGGATTRGFSMVETPFIATLDADDLWLSGKMERQFARFAADPTLSGVFTHLVNFEGDPATATRGEPYGGWNRTTMVVRTEVALETGAVADPKGGGDMIDWIARLRAGGHRLEMLPETLALRRVHENNMTRDTAAIKHGYLQVAREAMLRARAKAGDKA